MQARTLALQSKALRFLNQAAAKGDFECYAALPRLDNEECHVVMSAAAFRPLNQIAMNEIDHLARAQVTTLARGLQQSPASILFIGGIHCFRHTIRVKQEDLSRFDRLKIF